MRVPRYSYLLEQFLRETGWPEPNLQTALRMQEALHFFHAHLAGWVGLPVDASDRGYRVHGYNPLAFKAGGKVTKLTAAMQAIDFNYPVRPMVLPRGSRVRRYGTRAERRGGPASGLWYTEKDQPAALLALPPDQTVAFLYEVVAAAPALQSTAGDMLVDWGMDPNPANKPTMGVDYHYRCGGGLQYTIPDARSHLRPL
jgi:hypothetical protein